MPPIVCVQYVARYYGCVTIVINRLSIYVAVYCPNKDVYQISTLLIILNFRIPYIYIYIYYIKCMGMLIIHMGNNS